MNDLPNIMTREEFAGRWTEIQKTYGTTRQTAGARFEQTIGELFSTAANRSWTQEMIAAEVGYNQSQVARMLTFGAFLAFMPTGIIEDFTSLKQPLTERRFRSFWTQTKDLYYGCIFAWNAYRAGNKPKAIKFDARKGHVEPVE